MSTKDKLKNRFLSLPSDFTFEELIRLFASVGYELDNKGKSSGSRVAFVKGDAVFTMHKPHPGNLVKKGTLRMVKEYLESKELIYENGKVTI